MSERDEKRDGGTAEAGTKAAEVTEAWLARVRELAEGWAPEPLDEAARTRFDARLLERIERRRSGRLRLLAWAACAAGVLLAWWGLGGEATPPLAERTATVASTHAEGEDADWRVAAWEWDLLLGSGVADEADADEALPEEYSAIASVFLAP